MNLLVTKKKVNEKYFALLLIFLSLIIFFLPQNFKLKFIILPTEIFLRPLVLSKEFLLSLKNYRKERNYFYELLTQQNLLLAELKKSLNISYRPLNILENFYVIKRANIISRDNSLKRYLVIDKGLNDSITVNLPVITEKGIVGKIIAVGEKMSVVETFYSPYSKISAKIQKNNYLSALSCKNDVLFLDYLDEDCQVEENDTIVSTELGGIFPEGLKIGVVKKIERKKEGNFRVIIEPIVNLLKIDDVLVLIRKEQKIKKDELEILLRQLELKLPEIKFIR
uniref:Cell shape-determining protein MreC n=1 Tax=candidate division WOR-3 bacterium TaxID=2052148 RepID=A0A7V3ZVT8_UNCW3